MVLYEVLCKRMEELIQMLKDYKAPYNSTQRVAAMIIDWDNNVIARNIKSLDVPTKRGFRRMSPQSGGAGVLHAEQRVLEEAKEKASGNILITTLEPCTWRKSGKSCADLIIETGISKVVFGYPDPYHPIDSEGYLKENGIEVTNLKEYTQEIARLTNGHTWQKKKQKLERLKRQRLIVNPEKVNREYLRGTGKLGGYDRAESKRELDKLLRGPD